MCALQRVQHTVLRTPVVRSRRRLSGSSVHAEWCINFIAQNGDRWIGPIAMVRNWTFCLFYVMAELWGSVVVSVLFWGFANTICTVKEAKQFYSIFGLGANVALVFSGQAVRHFSNVRAKLPPGVDGWEVSLRGMMGLVVLFGLGICGLRHFLQKTVVENPMADLPTTTKKQKDKPNMGIMESFKFLANSTYIRCMATLVVCYGIAINIVEVTWKSKLKAQYPNPNDYSTFMGNFSTCTGIATFTLMLMSKWIFMDEVKGWNIAARITPIVLGVTGIMFFSLLLFGGAVEPLLNKWGITPLFAAVIVGALQNIFSKGSKYSLFDPCKEMAYIPLDTEIKTKGKAAIDVICNPLGKSGGAFIQQILIVTFGSLAASTPYLGAILLVIIAAWLQAATRLGKEFEDLTAQRAAEEIRDAGKGAA
jgi:ATP:ADP antiporter, AAA family